MLISSALRSATALWNCSSAILKAVSAPSSMAPCSKQRKRVAQDIVGLGLHPVEFVGGIAAARGRNHVQQPFAQTCCCCCARPSSGNRRTRRRPSPSPTAPSAPTRCNRCSDRGRSFPRRRHRPRRPDARGCTASLSVSGVSIFAASGKSVFSGLADREQLPGEGGDGRFRKAFARHDVVGEADRLDLFLGPGGRPPKAPAGISEAS